MILKTWFDSTVEVRRFENPARTTLQTSTNFGVRQAITEERDIYHRPGGTFMSGRSEKKKRGAVALQAAALRRDSGETFQKLREEAWKEGLDLGLGDDGPSVGQEPVGFLDGGFPVYQVDGDLVAYVPIEDMRD